MNGERPAKSLRTHGVNVSYLYLLWPLLPDSFLNFSGVDKEGQWGDHASNDFR